MHNQKIIYFKSFILILFYILCQYYYSILLTMERRIYYCERSDQSDESQDDSSNNTILYAAYQYNEENTFLNQRHVEIQNQGAIDGQELISQGVQFRPEYQQKRYPYSNSICFRIIIPSHIHSSGKQSLGLGSGVIVNIQGKKYIATACHNLYDIPSTSWMKSYAFLKKENMFNHIRKKMQIQQSMIHYNESFIKKGNSWDQSTFIQVDNSLTGYIQDNQGLNILFDWDKIRQQQVYLMGFPFRQNSKINDMTDIENSSSLHLCYRKLKTHQLKQNNKFLTYKTTTQQGQSGGALLIFRKEQKKYYLIGLHVGKCKETNSNIGVLFTSQIKQKFPQIFKKRQIPKNQEQDQNNSISQIYSSMRKIRLVQDKNYNLNPIYKQQMKESTEKQQMLNQKQIQKRAARDFYYYLIQQYNIRNDRGNESGSAKDWSDFFGRIKKQCRIQIQFLEKNQKCKGILHRIISNIDSQKSKFDELMYLSNRSFQFSESTIAKILRVHILPHAQELVKILQCKELVQIHKPYAWQYFPGGRRQPF